MENKGYFESKRRGSKEFPLEYYYIDNSHERYVMSAHWHNDLELIRVKEGRFTLYLNGVEQILNSGEAMFIGGGCIHRGKPKNCIYECVVFNADMLIGEKNTLTDNFISYLTSGGYSFGCVIKKDSKEKELVDEFFLEVSTTPPFYELSACGLLFKLFSLLYRQNVLPLPSTAPKNRQAESIAKILKYIEKNYAENITLTSLADMVGFSEKYLCRIFKEYTSKTVVRYINEIRIDNACKEIVTGRKNVTEAALDNGFNDLSYFSKIFKLYKGVSPSKLKQRP